MAQSFGAVGDIHGDFDSARRLMERHAEIPLWLCVGDVAAADGHYEALPAPLYWIKGNNENFDAIADTDGDVARNLHYIPNGVLLDLPGGLRVAGLGGTFAPTMYEMSATELPHPKKSTAKATEQADRRRHFVREEVERCRALHDVDVFLSHEAPVPFRVGRVQAGKRSINDILIALKPRLHLFGHHHRFQELTAEGVRCVCLAAVGESYLLIDRKTLEYQHLAS
jgi:calcineurin-like phosphoesterase family protein